MARRCSPPPPERIGQPCPRGCGRPRCPGRPWCMECVEEQLALVCYMAPRAQRADFAGQRTFRNRKLIGGML